MPSASAGKKTNNRGRRAKQETELALVLIGRWVEAYGEPKPGETARIVEYVLSQIEGVERSTIFDLVAHYVRRAAACKGPPNLESKQ